MQNNITSFSGEYRFLSNFYPSPVTLDGETYPTVEHAYQAAKTLDPDLRRAIRASATPAIAKRLGRKVEPRADWDRKTRINLMGGLLLQKFSIDPLRTKLKETGGVLLVEGNSWGDTFWGQCPLGKGENYLGLLLMIVRFRIQNADAKDGDFARWYGQGLLNGAGSA